MPFNLFMHHIVLFILYFFCANLQSAIGCFFFVFVLFCISVLSLAPGLGRLELIGLPPFPLCLPLGISFLRMTIAESPLRN